MYFSNNKMVEEKQEETKEETKPNMVEGAMSVVDQLKAENDRTETNIKKLEELKAVEILGGKSNAGEQAEEPKEETPKEYADRVIAGGLNDKRA